MSYIGAIGLTEYEERFEELENKISTSDTGILSAIVGIPDPIHLAIYGINIFNPGLYGIVERAEVNISQLQTSVGGLDTTIGEIEASIGEMEASIIALESSVAALTTVTTTITSDLLYLNSTTLPTMAIAISGASGTAASALVKANKSLDIWDEDGNNVYHKKSGNVGIGITFSTPLTNKLEVNGDINIPTGSSYKVNNVPLVSATPINSGTIIGIANNTLNIVDRINTGFYPVISYPLMSYEPIITPAIQETFIYLNNTTSPQEFHTFTLTEQTHCSVLMVGGGGAGDRQAGGGGGGGAVIYTLSALIPSGSHIIKVGKGGSALSNESGSPTEAFGAMCLGGGSTSYIAWSQGNNGTSGGSGSGGSAGGSSSLSSQLQGGGVVASSKGTILSSAYLYNGRNGGSASPQSLVLPNNILSGGGGGVGQVGNNASNINYFTREAWLAAGSPGKGGEGININGVYWAAGGGGGSYYTHPGDGGRGGGGGGGCSNSNQVPGQGGATCYTLGENGDNVTEVGGKGGQGTGSGGGGGGFAGYGGDGGCGCVIIKYDKIHTPVGNPITEKIINISYDVSKPNIYEIFFEEGSSVSINGGPIQLLNGSYTVTLTQTSVTMVKNIGNISIYNSLILSNISIQYSLTRTVTTMTPYKKAGIIKYSPTSGITYPTTGNWEVVDFESISSWVDNGTSIVYNSGRVVIGTDIFTPGNSKLTVNDSIQIIGLEYPSFCIKKINASGLVLKILDLYFNLTNDNVTFSIADSAYNFLIGSIVRMAISTSGSEFNESIQIKSEGFPSFSMKKINALDVVLKTFDIKFNSPDDNLYFKLSNITQNYMFLFNNTIKTTISSNGMDVLGTIKCNYLVTTGNAGIGVLYPAYRCHIKILLDNLENSFHLDASDTSDPNRYSLTIWAYSLGVNKVGWKFTTRSVDGGITLPLNFNNIGYVGLGIDDPLTKLHVNGKLTVNTVQIAPPSVGVSGGIGDRIVFWNGTSTRQPFSLGINDSTLWYSVPDDCSHQFYVNGVKRVHINKLGVGIGIESPIYSLYIAGGDNTSNDLLKRYIRQDANGIASTTGNFYVIANFSGNIWCSVGTIYVSSDARIKKNIVDINDDTALDKILNIQPKTYEYKDFINRGTKRVYGFISQQIAEIIPEAVSTQKGTLYDIYNNFKCDGNIIHININDYEGTYNVGDVLNCITQKYEVNYTIIEKYDNKVIVDKVIDGSDIFINGKIVDDFNVLDKNYIYTLNVSATQQLHRIIMEQKNEINDLKTRLERLEAIINSSLIVDGNN